MFKTRQEKAIEAAGKRWETICTAFQYISQMSEPELNGFKAMFPEAAKRLQGGAQVILMGENDADSVELRTAGGVPSKRTWKTVRRSDEDPLKGGLEGEWVIYSRGAEHKLIELGIMEGEEK